MYRYANLDNIILFSIILFESECNCIFVSDNYSKEKILIKKLKLIFSRKVFMICLIVINLIHVINVCKNEVFHMHV